MQSRGGSRLNSVNAQVYCKTIGFMLRIVDRYLARELNGFDNLIYEITADAHDEDEQLMGFEAAFDEDASFPCPGTVVGEDVRRLSRPGALRELPQGAPRERVLHPAAGDENRLAQYRRHA